METHLDCHPASYRVSSQVDIYVLSECRADVIKQLHLCLHLRFEIKRL